MSDEKTNRMLKKQIGFKFTREGLPYWSAEEKNPFYSPDEQKQMILSKSDLKWVWLTIAGIYSCRCATGEKIINAGQDI